MPPSGPRERYLEALVAWQRRLLDRPDRVDAELLGLLGTAAGADHVFLVTVTRAADGTRQADYELEWCAPGAAPRRGDPRLHGYRWGSLLPAAVARLDRGEAVAAARDELPEPDRTNLAELGVGAVVMLPVAPGGETAGVLGLDSAGTRPWSAAEVALLGAAAAALAAARERVRAEQALRAGEERSKRLIAELPVGVYRTAPDGRVLFCNV